LKALEESLRDVSKRKPETLAVVEPAAAIEVADEPLTVNVIRGMKEQSYTVTRDAAANW
jgi:hypothetical protein